MKDVFRQESELTRTGAGRHSVNHRGGGTHPAQLKEVDLVSQQRWLGLARAK